MHAVRFPHLAALLLTASLLFACGGSPEPPPLSHPLGGDFTLTDQDNAPFKLASRRGKVVLLYFGYTLCPEACPTMLAKLVRVFHLLGPRAKDVEVVFVSVDPRRDTPATLKSYLSYFKIPVTGLTGTKEEIDRVVHQYGAFYEFTDSGSAAGPLVNHSTHLYAIDRKGELGPLFAHDDPPDRIAAEIEKLLR